MVVKITPPTSNSIQVSDESIDQGRIREIDFAGAGVTAAVAGDKATVTIPGGGAGDMLKSTYDPNEDGVIAAAQLDPALATDAEVTTAVSNHEAAADPHTGYRLESADHSHQSTGAQAGKLDHGLALDGLSDDDHPQYRKESDDITTITFIIDGGGSAITTGEKGHLEIPFAGTIQGWTLLADQSGSIVIDVWKDTYANFPPTVADTIAGSEKPTLSSVQKNQDLTLTTWTTAIAAGDILAFNVDSVTTVTRVTLSIKVLRT